MTQRQRRVDWKYISNIEDKLRPVIKGNPKPIIYDKDNGIIFYDGHDKKDHSCWCECCCWSCEANVFVAALIKDGNEFHIKRYGFLDYHKNSYKDDYIDIVYQDHDEMNDTHPFSKYKQIINNNPKNDYYLFLLKKLQEKDRQFRNESKGKDEWSLMFLALTYLERGALKE